MGGYLPRHFTITAVEAKDKLSRNRGALDQAIAGRMAASLEAGP